jgi:hypothetical protein
VEEAFPIAGEGDSTCSKPRKGLDTILSEDVEVGSFIPYGSITVLRNEFENNRKVCYTHRKVF